MGIIGIDFDGTCVTHEFPEVGKEIGAGPVIAELCEAGHKIILFTVRSDGQYYPFVLTDAMNWFKDINVPLFGVNKNPEQGSWTTSPKPYCHLYIDDAALGIPLKFNYISARPYVDWQKVRYLLINKEYLTPSKEARNEDNSRNKR